MTRVCKWCGAEYVPTNPLSQFCSPICGSRFQHHKCGEREFAAAMGAEVVSPGLYRRKCQWCGEPFETGNLRKRNCSSLCGKYLARSGGVSKAEWKASVAARRERNTSTERKCRYCGRSYVAEKDYAGRSVYCSESCKTSYLEHGCDKAEHERRMASRDIELMTHSKYINGVNVRIRESVVVCPWCLNAFKSSYGRRFCRTSHAILFHYHGDMSAEDARKSRVAVCKWCGSAFHYDRKGREFCCESHRDRYKWWRRSVTGGCRITYGTYENCVRILASGKCDPGLVDMALNAVSGYEDRAERAEAAWLGISQNGISPRSTAAARIRRIIESGYPNYEDAIRHEVAEYLMSSISRMEHLKVQRAYLELFRGCYVCSSCGKLVDPEKEGPTARKTMCRVCSDAAVVAHREYAIEYARTHRKEMRERHRRYYLEHREEIIARAIAYKRNSPDYLRRVEAARIVEERLSAEAEAEEVRISETRRKFRSVELVMMMPPEDRWEFSKNWTDEERAYAASLVDDGNDPRGFDLLDGSDLELGIEDFSE